MLGSSILNCDFYLYQYHIPVVLAYAFLISSSIMTALNNSTYPYLNSLNTGWSSPELGHKLISIGDVRFPARHSRVGSSSKTAKYKRSEGPVLQDALLSHTAGIDSASPSRFSLTDYRYWAKHNFWWNPPDFTIMPYVSDLGETKTSRSRSRNSFIWLFWR